MRPLKKETFFDSIYPIPCLSPRDFYFDFTGCTVPLLGPIMENKLPVYPHDHQCGQEKGPPGHSGDPVEEHDALGSRHASTHARVRARARGASRWMCHPLRAELVPVALLSRLARPAVVSSLWTALHDALGVGGRYRVVGTGGACGHVDRIRVSPASRTCMNLDQF